MKKLIYSFLLLFSLAGHQALSQQMPQFSHYAFNGMYLSPGYAGISGQAEINGIFRYQWFNYQGSFDGGGAPKTGLFSFSVPVAALKGGFGGHIIQDQLGATTVSNAALAYAQHIRIGAGKLGIGLQGTITRLHKGQYRANDPDDSHIPENSSDRKFDAGAGIWYQAERFYFGVGMNNLLRSQYVLENKRREGADSAGLVTGENHLYVTGGINVAVAENLTVSPTVIGKYDFNQLSWEGGARLTYNEKMWIGAGYRNQEAITGMVGGFPLKENTLRLSYAFDLTNFGVAAKTKSSHEIMISYIFPKPANLIRPPVKTPRYNF
jgi:type IX secretion system PorP/SprF family membrane protein